MTNHLHVEGLSCVDQDITPILDHIDFSLNDGEVLSVFSDQRLSTLALINVLLGLMKPVSGSIQWGSANATSYVGPELFQPESLPLPVQDLIDLKRSHSKNWSLDDEAIWRNRLQLEKTARTERDAFYLSWVLAISSRPSILVMDRIPHWVPDEILRPMWDWIRDHRISTLHVVNSLDDIQSNATKIMVIYHGKPLIYSGVEAISKLVKKVFVDNQGRHLEDCLGIEGVGTIQHHGQLSIVYVHQHYHAILSLLEEEGFNILHSEDYPLREYLDQLCPNMRGCTPT